MARATAGTSIVQQVAHIVPGPFAKASPSLPDGAALPVIGRRKRLRYGSCGGSLVGAAEGDVERLSLPARGSDAFDED